MSKLEDIVDAPEGESHEAPKADGQVGDVDVHQRSTALSTLITLTMPL